MKMSYTAIVAVVFKPIADKHQQKGSLAIFKTPRDVWNLSDVLNALFPVAQVEYAFAVKAYSSNQSESSHWVILSTQRLFLEMHQVFKTMFMNLQVIPRNFVYIGRLYSIPPHIFMMYAHSPIQVHC